MRISEDIAASDNYTDITDVFMLMSLCEKIKQNAFEERGKSYIKNLYLEINKPNEYFDRIFLT